MISAQIVFGYNNRLLEKPERIHYQVTGWKSFLCLEFKLLFMFLTVTWFNISVLQTISNEEYFVSKHAMYAEIINRHICGTKAFHRAGKCSGNTLLQ